MKKFINFLENKLLCWKLLVIYMALTLWNAPGWAFKAFWICVIGYVSLLALIVILAIIVAVVEESRKLKAQNHGKTK